MTKKWWPCSLTPWTPPFYEHAINGASSNFSDLVIIGERVEAGIRSGRIGSTIPSTNRFGYHPDAKKREETYAVASAPKWGNRHPRPINPPSHDQGPHPSQAYDQGIQSGQERGLTKFTSIPMTYTELLHILLSNALVAIIPAKPVKPPYPKGFDINATCDYHGGTAGHSTEMCRTLQNKVQSLIDAGWLNFEEDGPSKSMQD